MRSAIAAHNEALQELTRERYSYDWADTKTNLANAFAALGEREAGTDDLQRAVAAYNEAAQVFVRERYPQQWAEIQNNICVTFIALGKRENGGEALQNAISACNNALQEYSFGAGANAVGRGTS